MRKRRSVSGGLRRRGGRSRTIRSRSSDGIHRTGSASGRSRRNGFLTDGRIPGNARRRVSVRGDCDGMLRTGRQIGVSADSDRGRDSRRSDPDHPVGPACGTHLHGRMSLRIEPPVESLVQGETVLFQHADAAYGQGLPLPDAFQPAAVHLLCGLRGFRLRHAARRQHAGDLLHQRHPPTLRGERHRPVGRPHAPRDNRCARRRSTQSDPTSGRKISPPAARTFPTTRPTCSSIGLLLIVSVFYANFPKRPPTPEPPSAPERPRTRRAASFRARSYKLPAG